MSVFDFDNKIFADIDILKTGTTPHSMKDIIHRQKELDELKYHFSPVMKSKIPSNLLMFGETGCGKTAMIKTLTRELRAEATARNINTTVHYVNCNSESSELEILKQLVAQYNMMHGARSPKLINSASQYFHHYIQCIKKTNGIVIIILDEIDKLKPCNLIYNLSRIKENEFTNFNVCIAGISNNFLFEKDRDPREISTFQPHRITVPPYTKQQLIDILHQKAKTALKPNTWTDNVLDTCATKSLTDGNARKAIELLRISVEHAEKAGKACVDEYDVIIAEKELTNGFVEKLLTSFPLQKSIMLLSCMQTIYKNEEIPATTARNAYEHYSKLCERYGTETYSERSFRSYLYEFDMEGLIKINKKSAGRAKGVYNKITTELDTTHTIETLLNTIEH